MSGMLEQEQHISDIEKQLKERFNTPPNPFYGEVPSTDILVNSVFIDTTLAELSKSMPFYVPDEYKYKTIAFPLNKLPKKQVSWIGFVQAACIVLLLSLSFLPFYQPTKSTLNQVSQFITAEEAQWYIENQTLNNDLLWYEWEEKFLIDENIAFLSSNDDLNTITLDEVNTFF